MVEAELIDQNIQTNEKKEFQKLPDNILEKLNPILKTHLDLLDNKIVNKFSDISKEFKALHKNSVNDIKTFYETELKKLYLKELNTLNKKIHSEIEELLNQFDPRLEELKSFFENKLEKILNLYKKESVRLLERILPYFDDIKNIMDKFEDTQGLIQQEIKKLTSRGQPQHSIFSLLFPKPRRLKNRKKSIFSMFRKVQSLLDSNTTTTLQFRKRLNEFRKFSRLHEKNYLLTREIYDFEKTLSLQDGILLNFKQSEKGLQLLEKIQKYIKPHSTIQIESQKETFESPLREFRKKIKYHLTGIELLYILKDIKKVLNKYNVKYEILEEFNRIMGYSRLLGENEIKRQNFKEIRRKLKKWDEYLKNI